MDNQPLESDFGFTGSAILAQMDRSSTNRRQLAGLFAVGALAMVVLLLSHPHEHAGTFADLVEFEVRHRVLNQFVHGGAIVVLILLLAAHVALARAAASTFSLTEVVAVTAFGAGCILMMSSLVLDGFVTTTLAVTYRAAEDTSVQLAIQAQLRFCALIIRTLMPMALLAFAGSAVAWLRPLLHYGGRGRLIGWLGGVIGVTIGLMISAATPATSNHAILVGLFLISLWQFALAVMVQGGPSVTSAANGSGARDGNRVVR